MIRKTVQEKTGKDGYKRNREMEEIPVTHHDDLAPTISTGLPY
jgi:hypothetical protein